MGRLADGRGPTRWWALAIVVPLLPLVVMRRYVEPGALTDIAFAGTPTRWVAAVSGSSASIADLRAAAVADLAFAVTFAVVGGLRGGAYSAAKGGLTSLTTHIAAQYGPLGIRCNAVAPGVTVTPMVEKRLDDPGFRKMQTEMTPHTRLGRVDDIASTIAFLCSEGGSFINGQTIVVDGGWSSTKYLSQFGLTSEWVAR